MTTPVRAPSAPAIALAPVEPSAQPVSLARRWLPTRIRTKLIFLHTMFSLVLAVALLLALHRPVRDLIVASEAREALLVLRLAKAAPAAAAALKMDGVRFESGSAVELGMSDELARAARSGAPAIVDRAASGWLEAVEWDPAPGVYHRASVRIIEAHNAVDRLYLLLTLALLAVYGSIAVAAEVLVLPRQIYRPLQTLLAADDAVRAEQRHQEIIPESQIPADEIGQIMRSRNQTVRKLREHEAALGGLVASLEHVAGELKRKNHLLETAQRNLADADRLASLGMMSAGIAHELNTPLAVLKGSVEELAAARPSLIPPERAALMLRVVGRLERLSESLLDFARVRPPRTEPVRLRDIAQEAWTLVSIDRDAKRVDFANDADPDLIVPGDGDRLTQVLVNLLRNAVDALDGTGSIRVTSLVAQRQGRPWASLLVSDNGPGIDPAVLPRLFEPFASTRLDAQGTGLGLAVAEGIVREHGGLILARNASPAGAVFEIMLPLERASPAPLDTLAQ